ncbi:hypothetical protein [Bartonella sp. TS25HLJMH]|uniref:hypothetical protein n=1 Tax=Bartonella sp. TS25HLJMH TaxID=3243576 RepID=UPI0035CEAB1D
MDPYKASGEINSQYVYSKNGTRFRVVEDPDEIEKIIRSHANTFPSSSSQYVYSKNGTRFRVVEDPSEIAKLSNSFSESQQSTVDQSSTPDSSPLDGQGLEQDACGLEPPYIWSHGRL